MPLRPAAGKHEPPSSPQQDQHTHSHPYTHTNGSQGASSDSGSSREEDSGIPVSVSDFSFRPARERSPSAGGGMAQDKGNTLVIRIGIPDLAQTKCMKFDVDAPIWLSKQHILCTLNQSLKDVLNYGLFQPAHNGKAGKFLDEERQLKEYPLPSATPVPYLEFRYKRRLYTQSHLDDKQLSKLHTKVRTHTHTQVWYSRSELLYIWCLFY
ncbi:SH3 and multiple ankyrin repeat domains protein 2-like [Oncorhynchus nerka]|uniref:SH3 and multiple ankyrin repeat domains protein 2-like n=1 Tax=Oncorhynchus nerka TaxID=8023 RepID=UPI0031B88572